jgi:uncharacterized repeat protein (TIGR03803 family)
MRFSSLFTIVIIILGGLTFENSAGAQTYSVLYNFGTNSGDPVSPEYSGIISQGRDGRLYSTTPAGGTNGGGAMFSITSHGVLETLFSFDGAHGSGSYSGLTLGTDDDFYGATITGGSYGWGTVFKATPSGTVTVLYNFGGSESDGVVPYAPPVEGSDGNFYGTTFAGGAYNGGIVYKITPSGKLTTLYVFDQTNGLWPYAPLVQGTDGNFYGTTSIGGAGGEGVVFKITSTGKFTLLHSFDGTDGARPDSPLVQGSDGNFYGTTTFGGSLNYGVVFKITPNGKLTVLHSMNGTTDGGIPTAGLMQATDGNFYGVNSDNGIGVNSGVIFSISPKSPYPFSALYTYNGTQGFNPEVTLLQHTNGILYGDNNVGGTAGSGTFFSFNIGTKPFVSLVTTSGKVGHTIGILGQGFKGATGVSFNGIPARFKVVSSTYLTAKVPSGATTGIVTVTTPGGKLKSNKKFHVNRGAHL